MIEKEMDEAPVLILEGGAMRGLFTAGVLDAFMDHRFYFKRQQVSLQALCRDWATCQSSAEEASGSIPPMPLIPGTWDFGIC